MVQYYFIIVEDKVASKNITPTFYTTFEFISRIIALYMITHKIGFNKEAFRAYYTSTTTYAAFSHTYFNILLLLFLFVRTTKSRIIANINVLLLQLEQQSLRCYIVYIYCNQYYTILKQKIKTSMIIIIFSYKVQKTQ